MAENTYSALKPRSLGERAVLSARMKMYRLLEREIPINDMGAILDAGATADRESDSSNFFEKMYPHPERITALSDQDASWLTDGKGVRFIRGDALDMPFGDDTFDLVFSSAVIEHVGRRENQARFIRECVRVSRKYVFITTPNRYYPIELHTALPLLHWLPPQTYRNILARINKPFFAREENLNLMCKKDLVAMMNKIGHAGYKIKHIRFLGFKSNLLLIIRKTEAEYGTNSRR
jgi:hypothetical protein